MSFFSFNEKKTHRSEHSTHLLRTRLLVQFLCMEHSYLKRFFFY